MNEELVISGMSGRFPESDNTDQLRDNLFSGKDLITEDDRRWPIGLLGLPKRSGKIKDITRFDAEMFGMNSNQSQNMDPMIRILLEVTYEAVVDSGYNPDTLRGRDVGVYIGCLSRDFAEAVHSHIDGINRDTAMGSLNSMIANRISYAFDFRGPSLVVDTACSSSLQALYSAYSDLRLGKIERAIVGGAHLALNPSMSLKFNKYNMLSQVGKCQFLDSEANGYARSEAVSVIVLERRSTAKRIYGTLLNINSNNDGYKVEGISYPSSTAQIALMKKTLSEVKVRPEDVYYIEAHGTGTHVGDKVEAYAIQEAYCQNRSDPILVGSIKTNLGHTEASSGLCSIIKVLIAIQNFSIPKNINYSKPNQEIRALIEGRIVPNIENTEFLGDSVIAINSFGMGGTNVHLLIKPEAYLSETKNINEGIPRLVTVRGRTEQSVEYLLDFMDNNSDKISNDFLALLAEVESVQSSRPMNYHGYLLFDPELRGEMRQSIQEFPNDKREVWFVLSGMGSQWKNMIEGLMAFPIFSDSIERSAEYLKDFEIDLIDLLTEDKKQMFDSFVGSSVGIAAVQIALIDILKELNIKWDGLIGHSAGEMMCSYVNGLMDAKQTLIAKYYFSKCFADSGLPEGQMGAIGLTWEEAEQRCPPNVYPACHNSENSVTISGLYSATKEFMDKLKEEKVFVKEVNSCGISFHCPLLMPIKEDIIQKLRPYIPRGKRSKKWLSSSVPSRLWLEEEESKYSSPEYFANNAVTPVLFDQCIKLIPKNAIVIEIAPDSLFRNILRKTVGEDMTYVGLMKRNNGANNLNHLLCSIGELHNLGLNPKIQKLYPNSGLPVRRGTQSLSPLIKWDHSEQWFVPLYPKYFNCNNNGIEFNQINNTSNKMDEQTPIITEKLRENDQTHVMQPNYMVKINKILGIRHSSKVKKDKKLHEFGLDSIMSVELTDVIQEEFRQNISIEELPNLSYGYLLDFKDNSV